jgi:chromosome segregation ATPase
VTSLLDIWLCLCVAALLGVFAGWIVWGRHVDRVIASYRGRLAKLRRNWETVEDALARELSRTSALETERDELRSKIKQSQTVYDSILEVKEEAWKEERCALEDAMQKLQDRIATLEGSQTPEMLLMRRRRPNRRSNPIP